MPDPDEEDLALLPVTVDTATGAAKTADGSIISPTRLKELAMRRKASRKKAPQ